jgi:hypothetical protein
MMEQSSSINAPHVSMLNFTPDNSLEALDWLTHNMCSCGTSVFGATGTYKPDAPFSYSYDVVVTATQGQSKKVWV